MMSDFTNILNILSIFYKFNQYKKTVVNLRYIGIEIEITGVQLTDRLKL